jgi:cytochrome c-type biogenesis protein CcmH/NrfF
VRGQQLRETPRSEPIQQLIWTYAALLGAVLLGGVAWQAWRTRRETRAPIPVPPLNAGAPA